MGAVSAEVVRLLGASLAERTWATYGRAVERFLQFRQAAGLEPNWPAPTNHIAAFIASLSLEGLAPSSISTHTSAVAFVHKMQGWPDPTDSFCIRKLKEGIRRGGQKADSRRPISFELLGRLYNVLGAIASSRYDTALFRAAFALAFFGFLRVGEFTARSMGADCSKVLSVDDVWFGGPGRSVMYVRLRFSKTDQRGESTDLIFQSLPTFSVCPVRSLSEYLSMRPSCHGPLFCKFDGSPLTASQFRMMLNRALGSLGIPAKGYNGHCFRIGAATWAAHLKVSGVQIQALGRWKSGAFNSYIRPHLV